MKRRLETLDLIRGISLVSMILYHATWDLVRTFGVPWPWFDSAGAEAWQKSICCTFILLSGICWPLGKHPLKRGLTVFACGALITFFTVVFMPEDTIIFGILTLIGTSMLAMIPLDRLFRKMNPSAGAGISFFLFLLFYHLNSQVCALFGHIFFIWPEQLFHGIVMTFLGFQEQGFYSVDYFSVLPWMLLFITGYFLCRAYQKHAEEKDKERTAGTGNAESCAGRAGCGRKWLHLSFAPFNFLGRYSLIVYMIHQPIVYGILWLIFSS